MSKAEGIYMSADYRATDGRTGKTLDDSSLKFLTVHYPPEGGPKALFGYTGIARLPQDGTPVGDWLLETLRGESEVFDVSTNHLRDRLDRDLAGFRVPLIINILAVHGTRRFFGGLSNVEAPNEGAWIVRDSFGYAMQELSHPIAFANGSGAARAVAESHWQKVQAQLHVRPRRVLDHMKLLATLNRRVAAHDDTVSPFCHVSFINADDRFSPASQVFLEHGESAPSSMRILLFGIDLSFMERHMHEMMEATREGRESPDLDTDAANRATRRRP
jgi:hypothetical protein